MNQAYDTTLSDFTFLKKSIVVQPARRYISFGSLKISYKKASRCYGTISSIYNVVLRIYVLGKRKGRMKIFALVRSILTFKTPLFTYNKLRTVIITSLKPYFQVLTIALLAVQVMPAPILQKFLPQFTRSGLKE